MDGAQILAQTPEQLAVAKKEVEIHRWVHPAFPATPRLPTKL
jgi:hypothetical protein